MSAPLNPQTPIAQGFKTFLDGTPPRSGEKSVSWDGRDRSGTPVASGMYFYRFVAGDVDRTLKMILLQ